MSYYYLHILCEGESEAGFVQNHLKKYFCQYNIDVRYSLISTNQQFKIKGGNTDYKNIKRDIENLLKTPSCILTTFIDYYKIPSNFPEYKECHKKSNVYSIKLCLETAMLEDIKKRNPNAAQRFIPYIQLHEFESLIFSDISNIKGKSEFKNELSKILKKYDNPELINANQPPSKRIMEIFPEYRNAKAHQSQYLMQNIQIENILTSCKGFNNWIESILNCFNQPK